MKRLLIATVAFAAIATPARADPISAAIVTFVGLTGTAAAVATFAINTALYALGSLVLSKIAGPKQRAQERQASVVQLSLGETPPEVIYGEAVTGGSLLDAFNFGGTYNTDWEVLVIDLCEHEIEDLVGYYIGDEYRAFSANGLQSGFSNCLDIEFVNASRTVPPTRFSSVSGGRWTSADVLAGVTRVWVAYKANEDVWSAGRPAFRWRIKGRKCIDPRNPGAGRVWTENASVCRYDYQRGIYAEDRDDEPAQLLIGRGLSEDEALADLVIAGANICDETVDTLTGTEARYRVGGVIRADETFESVESLFAAAMAGIIVQREGGVLVEPGAAKAPVFEITDDDLLSAEGLEFSDFLPEPDRVNTVVPRYIEPSQGWKDHGAPVKRDLADIAADKGALELTLSMSLVTSGEQAQRNGEIARRLGRLERRCSLTLGPRFAFVEDGDWGTFTSSRHTGGEPMTVRVEAYSLDEGWKNKLVLREISAEAFDDPESEQPGAAADDPLTPPPRFNAARIPIRRTSLDESELFPAVTSATSTTITIIDHKAWFQRSPPEDFTGDTVSGLTPSTFYGVFGQNGGSYEVEPSPALTRLGSDAWVFMGWQATPDGGGTYPTLDPPPPGSGGSGETPVYPDY